MDPHLIVSEVYGSRFIAEYDAILKITADKPASVVSSDDSTRFRDLSPPLPIAS